MGTTLTGTTPQDTYDSLIKVTDNGPLSGTAKYLSDGLGNDSTLALSTSRVGIGTASPLLTLHLYNSEAALAYFESTNVSGAYVIWRNSGTSIGDVGSQVGISGTGSASNFMIASRSGDMILGSNSSERMRITSAGNVGIGTSSPESKLHISGSASGSDVTLYIDNAASSALNNSSRLKFSSDLGSSVSNGGAELNCIVVDAGNGAVDLVIKSYTGAAYTEKARFLATGGLTFNGDTAAANALDDYEEGTFTPTIIGSTTAGTATYGGGQAGSYTKIGNVVYFQIYLGYSGGTGTGDLRIAGLPFTVPSSDLPSFTFGVFLNVALTALNVPIAGGIGSTNQIYINQIPTGGGSQTSVPYDGVGVIQISGFYRV